MNRAAKRSQPSRGRDRRTLVTGVAPTSGTFTGMVTPAPVFHRYVAIGDSSTEGLDDPDGRGGYRGWANRLADLIAQRQDAPLLYANLAVRGLTTSQIRETQLAPALALRPDLVTLFCGTNDVVRRRFDLAQFERDLLHMQRACIAGG